MKEQLRKHAMALYDFCEYPAVRYKLLFSILDTPYEDELLPALREQFLKSDIVEEMNELQDEYGGWGRFRSKDYSVRAKIPTSSTGINRCLYIGLTIHDRDLLFLAKEYLLSLLDGTSPEVLFEKNERANPWQTAEVRHLGGEASIRGHFWDKTPDQLPDEFQNRMMRRWFHTFNYINQFRGSGLYLKDAVAWLIDQAGPDGLWDWGPQVNDPWGYFGYFSCNRHYKHNRVVDGTMEILNFLKKYVDHNPCK